MSFHSCLHRMLEILYLYQQFVANRTHSKCWKGFCLLKVHKSKSQWTKCLQIDRSFIFVSFQETGKEEFHNRISSFHWNRSLLPILSRIFSQFPKVKSIITNWNITFSGLISRWMYPNEWIILSPSRVFLMIGATSF